MENPNQFTPKPRRRVTQLALFSGGKWSLASVDSFTFTKADNFREYTRMTIPFGLLLEGETDLTRIAFMGGVSDYLFRDFQGNLSVVLENNFKSIV